MNSNQTGVEKLPQLGPILAEKATANGSMPIIEPLIKQLSNNVNGLNLRDKARKDRPIMIADIAHYLCVAHGRHPGIIEHAMSKTIDACSREWLVKAADGFTRERIYLTEITVAAGPISRTTGQDETDMLIVNQSKQYQMLASSDRRGCPIGAAATFMIDWHNIRKLLDILALHLNIYVPQTTLPSAIETQEMINQYADSPNIIRAINFGADQILAQQRAFWNIITARSIARKAI